MDNNTRILLGIKDENIELVPNSAVFSESDQILYISGILDYRPKACFFCGASNRNQTIINFGWRETIVRLPRNFERDVSLKLKRRYFACKECHHHFLAQTDLVPKNCSISNNTRFACVEKLTEPVSMKHIAKELTTSISFVERTLDHARRDCRPDFNWLPEIILMDEVKSTRAAKGAMSFEFMDADTHQLIDLLDARSTYYIEKYFYQYPTEVRAQVKVIVTDMNYTYPKLVQKIFPNAIVVTDRFHIISNLTRAFNKTRIRIMKQLAPSSNIYKMLKKYWKILLKPADRLNYKHFHTWSYTKKWLTETDLVDLMLIDPDLTQSYQVLQRMMLAVQNRNWSEFKYGLEMASQLSEEMQKTLETLNGNQRSIYNAFKYDYSNGPLEGINNKIKLIKRNAFGFRSFVHFRTRILLVFKFRTTKKGLVTK